MSTISSPQSSSPASLLADTSTHTTPAPSSTAGSSPPPNALSEYSGDGGTRASSEAFDVPMVGLSNEEKFVEAVTKVTEEELLTEEEDSETARRLARLKFVLEKSAVYSSILKERMDEDKARQLAEQQARRAKAAKTKASSASITTKNMKSLRKSSRKSIGQKRTRIESESDGSDVEMEEGKGGKRKKGVNGEVVKHTEEGEEEAPVFEQPTLITGAKLKQYQLEGLQWMVSLDQNGISGILADEMGLGKTLQTIAFSAYLREHHNARPFLIVCPLSVLHNWADEYKKFAPTIPICIYHGTPAERAEMRKTVMALPGSKAAAAAVPQPAKKGRPKKGAKSKQAPVKSTKTKNAKASSSAKRTPAPEAVRKSGRPRKSVIVIESDDEGEYREEEMNEGDSYVEDEDQDEKMEEDIPAPASIPPEVVEEVDPFANFPIVLTTYEMIIKDRAALAHYDWGYIVVDEGHRLKNLDCKLMREIKKYRSAGRMILTGTPLHNNLAELWSLLNFILPDIFDDVDSFQEWFNLPSLQTSLPTDQSTQIISALHAILKPFLLRRLKVDVETNLPPKKEYVLYAPLSVRQREAYESVLSGEIRRWLIDGGTGSEEIKKLAKEEAEKDASKAEEEEDTKSEQDEEGDKGKSIAKTKGQGRTLRKRKGGRKRYTVDDNDEEYFEMLERGDLDARGVVSKQTEEERESEEARVGREHQMKTKVKHVNNMKLQNMVMQLRKVCSHPFLFDWPVDPKTHDLVLGEELVNASGKMMVLDRLLRELFKRKHKVLLFSQFTTMLDIIEDWAVDFMDWKICRIDGSTGPMERREQMNIFQTGGDSPDAPCLFLLSTRAGGLGINLVAADTVIFYDQDWNPQMDAQAQDRAHRIGQTKPVLIFRLVSAHTVETKIMQRATEKRKLEALVIAKGKFKAPAAAASGKRETMAEMAASLLKLEGEKIEVVPNTKEGKASVLSDEDLEMLLDRRPEVFAGRQKGWTSSREDTAAGTGTAMKAEREVDANLSGGKKAAFAVYEAPTEVGNDALAKMMGEDVSE
ncbi:SNF2 family N-terminal domain-containing protein [Crucibulum laeve]|uniref:SNF2 family N-terminal domain-containing protein n=1 Tax=Crucibulum laeve TaxID=68775 RepID=A0A5C3LJV6_9AGAR|nr:SNF2 family N-terminal domain-containing protein [Crucibulum laeve]